MTDTPKQSSSHYEAPALVELGALQELTLGCDKFFGGSDGFTFLSQPIECVSTSA